MKCCIAFMVFLLDIVTKTIQGGEGKLVTKALPAKLNKCTLTTFSNRTQVNSLEVCEKKKKSTESNTRAPFSPQNRYIIYLLLSQIVAL